MTPPRIHLASYATPIFLPRQWFLERSALTNRVCHSVNSWRPKDLNTADFQKRAPRISLSSRGSGYWAWKPFIIEHHLQRMPDGDILLYCDVGRRNDFKLLDRPLDPYLQWMEERGQDVMPGVRIPWKGPMSMWTKRDAFVFTDMDTAEAHAACPIQASFSLWRAGPKARQFAKDWMDWCAEPRLIGDERGTCGLPELEDFKDHRHDQSLLTLRCLQHGIEGLDLGLEMPSIDTQHPSEVSDWVFRPNSPTLPAAGKLLHVSAKTCGWIEKTVRKRVKIG